ncbi:MAG TPA: transglycosylase SLT domain-containing protein [Terriglobales bacterium]|nr:transglycosylase SLT domain-containing protein [Terriglobales bacterium]
MAAAALLLLCAAAPGGAQAQRTPGDPVQALVQSLEQQYSSALHLYQVGRLDEARAAFDATLDRLLGTNYSIPDTPALQKELDSLLDRIHAIESDTLDSGGMSNTRPTPKETIPELTFPIDAATRAEIEKSTAPATTASAPDKAQELPIELNDTVIRYIHYFTTTGREGLLRDYRRAGRYRAMIDRIFTSEGIPDELIYLAQLESSYDPVLVSRAGARGMWQFMASRSEDYGLKRTAWVDERDDPEKATRAAAEHLKDLYKEFGDWFLAMAAYNAGPGAIQKIVARTGYADYWTLYARNDLPRYVRNYVPVILATALIARNPEKYGLPPVVPDAPYQVDEMPLDAAVDLKLIADCASVTVSDLQHLNPSLLHTRAPAGFELKLPAGTGQQVSQVLERIPAGDRLSWRVHWSRAGDTWAALARQYHLTPDRLAGANETTASTPIAEGTAVLLPVGADGGRTAPRKKTSRKLHL